MLEYPHESFCGDSLFTVPTFEIYFKFPIPKANKERLILRRNKLGQIVKSVAQSIALET